MKSPIFLLIVLEIFIDATVVCVVIDVGRGCALAVGRVVATSGAMVIVRC
jgi:hypothetical protein